KYPDVEWPVTANPQAKVCIDESFAAWFDRNRRITHRAGSYWYSNRITVPVYFPYSLAALPIDVLALARSCGFMIGRKDTFALNARNQGSAIEGICDVSFMSNTIEADR